MSNVSSRIEDIPSAWRAARSVDLRLVAPRSRSARLRNVFRAFFGIRRRLDHRRRSHAFQGIRRCAREHFATAPLERLFNHVTLLPPVVGHATFRQFGSRGLKMAKATTKRKPAKKAAAKKGTRKTASKKRTATKKTATKKSATKKSAAKKTARKVARKATRKTASKKVARKSTRKAATKKRGATKKVAKKAARKAPVKRRTVARKPKAAPPAPETPETV